MCVLVYIIILAIIIFVNDRKVNHQSHDSCVLKSGEAMGKINRLCRCIYGAPMVFLICSDESKTWKSQTEPGYSTGEMDCSIVCTHMMLEAWEQGIGSVWVRQKGVYPMPRGMMSVETSRNSLRCCKKKK